MSDAPDDVVGRILYKALGNRSPDEFVPKILPKKIKTPHELAQSVGKDDSVDSIVRSFIPIDIPEVIGDVETDVAHFADSLTPENVLGSKGDIDLPEPGPLSLFKGRRSRIRDLSLKNIMKNGPKLPPAPWD